MMGRIVEGIKRTGNKVQSTVTRYERHLSVCSFFVGFVFDLVSLPRVDATLTYIVLFAYLSFVAVALFAQEFPYRDRRLKALFVFATQFFFGSLMSAMVVYYSRSAMLLSWPLFVFFASFILANEFLQDEKRKLAFDLVLFYFILFMATNFAIPVYLGTLGVHTFLLAGVLSIVIFVAYLLFFVVAFPRLISTSARHIGLGVAVVYIVLHGLYFSSLIPPIPLALTRADVAHSVTKRIDGTYRITKEPASWTSIMGADPVIHRTDGPLYFFSAVFAPTAFATTIEHEWQSYDERNGAWKTMHRVAFPISGGREGGYRGYSLSEQVTAGLWRVRVRTGDGVLVGTTRFRVIEHEGEIVTESLDR